MMVDRKTNEMISEEEHRQYLEALEEEKRTEEENLEDFRRFVEDWSDWFDKWHPKRARRKHEHKK